MKLFGFRIISESEYKNLVKGNLIKNRVIQCHRWFSGWTDLDVIWDYLLNSEYFGTVNDVRNRYAIERKTDCYGKTKESKEV